MMTEEGFSAPDAANDPYEHGKAEGRREALEEARGIVGTSVCCDDACMRGDDCIKGRIDSRLYARLAAKEGK